MWFWRKLLWIIIGLMAGEATPAKKPDDKRKKGASAEHTEVKIPNYDSWVHRPLVTATTSDVVTFTTSLPMEFISSPDRGDSDKRSGDEVTKHEKKLKNEKKGSDKYE
jgi:hypothetical protein